MLKRCRDYRRSTRRSLKHARTGASASEDEIHSGRARSRGSWRFGAYNLRASATVPGGDAEDCLSEVFGPPAA